MIGQTLSHFEITAKLGEGGMGEVYRARDPRLERDVAIKVLPERYSEDPERVKRFQQEACAAGQLNHPNILTVYDVGMHEGLAYIVTELLEGGTLRDRLRKGAIPTEQAIDYTVQLTSGLAAAHEKGIIHRDLKPENVSVSPEGRIKILDFGLAKFRQIEASADDRTLTANDVAQTAAGTILGTVGYMAPEQVRGLAADHRADIFAVGVVLYEMLSGRRAFRERTHADTLSAMLIADPAPIEVVAPSLNRIVLRCLEKDAGDRFDSARDLAFALKAADETPASKARSVAVLFFKDLLGSEDNAHLGVGMSDAIITELAQIRSLVVRPTAAIHRYQEDAVEPQQAGRELKVDAVVDGNFQRSGDRIRVTVQMIDTRSGTSLWATKIDTSIQDIFEMQDEVSRRVAEALRVELSPADERRMAVSAHTASPGYEQLLRGRLLLYRENVGDTHTAADWFDRARKQDPSFAPAWAGLADAYARLAFSFEPNKGWQHKAEEAIAQALALDPELPEGHYVKARILWSPHAGFDHAKAIRELAFAVRARPGLNEAYERLGTILFHVSMLDESERFLRRGLEIDPDDWISKIQIGCCLYHAGRYGEALDVTASVLRHAPSRWAYYQHALCQLQLGLVTEAAGSIERARSDYPRSAFSHSAASIIAAKQGDAEEARRQIDAVADFERLGHFHHAQHDVACAWALLGQPDAAMEWLTEAAATGFPCHRSFAHDPHLASLREDERFTKLMADLETECSGYRQLYRELDLAQFLL